MTFAIGPKVSCSEETIILVVIVHFNIDLIIICFAICLQWKVDLNILSVCDSLISFSFDLIPSLPELLNWHLYIRGEPYYTFSWIAASPGFNHKD